MTKRAWSGPTCRRLVLAVLAGLAAGAAAWLWSDRPCWQRKEFGGCEPGGFSNGGNELVTFHGLIPAKGFKPHRVRWDVATGRPVAVTEIAWEGPALNPADRFFLADIPGGQRMFVGIKPWDTEHRFSRWHFYVHDTATGRRTAGPIWSENCLNDAFCSADGRRFLDVRHTASDSFDAVSVWDVATCSEVTTLHFPDRADTRATRAILSPDGEQVAVQWKPNQPAGPHFVEVYDVRSGHATRRLDQRAGLRWGIWKWADDDRLYAFAGADAPPSHAISFSMADSDFAAERAERSPYYFRGEGWSTTWEAGERWVARLYETVENEPLWRPWLMAAARRVGLKMGPLDSTTRVSFLDPETNALRAELSSVAGACAIAPSGRWVAGLHTQRGVEMWDAERVSPKTWALAAGLIGFGGVLVSRRRAGGRVASGIPQRASR